MSRKDSKGLFASVLANQAAPVPAPNKSASPHLLKVAAGVRQIQERGEALDRLLKDGEHIAEIDPDDIAPSAIADRFDGAYDTAAIDEIVASMRERGQIVPGLVRLVSGQSKQYQIVFGRRRLAAAKALGVKFRAIVRNLSDEQAIVFQGEENTNRNDLSFIEKCAFALSLEQAGFGRNVISAALSTGKSHISEMLSIASALPRDILLLIGPAREIGRRRWLELVEKWNASAEAHKHVTQALDKASADRETDRFAIALAALSQQSGHERVNLRTTEEVSARGLLIATVNYSKAGAKMTFTKSVPADFVRFLSERMEDLHDTYMKETNKTGKGN